MDRHSEIELKFSADGVSLRDYHNFIVSVSVAEEKVANKKCRILKYKRVSGKDTYFNLGGQALRFREDGERESELTYKQRKSNTNISDRVEINLPFRKGVSHYDVRSLLGYLGAEEDFCIEKTSYIYHVQGLVRNQGSGVELQYYGATLALYDVTDEDGNQRRFLEVEVDSDSTCSPEAGLKVLDRWKRLIQNHLKVKGPLNQSLYEIYTTKGKKK